MRRPGDLQRPGDMRLLEWIIRRSWCKGSHFAIDATGRPLLQRDLARDLGLTAQQASRSIARLKRRQLVHAGSKILAPGDAVLRTSVTSRAAGG